MIIYCDSGGNISTVPSTIPFGSALTEVVIISPQIGATAELRIKPPNGVYLPPIVCAPKINSDGLMVYHAKLPKNVASARGRATYQLKFTLSDGSQLSSYSGSFNISAGVPVDIPETVEELGETSIENLLASLSSLASTILSLKNIEDRIGVDEKLETVSQTIIGAINEIENSGKIIEVDALPTDNINKLAMYLFERNFYIWVDGDKWQFKDGELTAIDVKSDYYDVYVDCSGYIYNEETGEHEEFSDFIFWDSDTGNPSSIEFKNAKTGKRIILYKDGSFVYPYTHRTVTFIVPPKDDKGSTDWLQENATNQGKFKKLNVGVELDTTLTQEGKAADAKAVGDAIAENARESQTIEVDALPTENINKTATYLCEGIGYKWFDSNAWKLNQLLTPLAAYAGGYQDIYFDCSGYFYHTETDEDIKFTELRFDIEPTDGTIYRVKVKEFESGEFIDIHYGSNGVDQFVKNETITFRSLPEDEAFLAWLNENATNQSGFKRITSVELDSTLTQEGKAADAWAVHNGFLNASGERYSIKKRIDWLEDKTIKLVETEADMDNELKWAAEEWENSSVYTGNYYYMFVGETTEKYKKGAVYKLKELV